MGRDSTMREACIADQQRALVGIGDRKGNPPALIVSSTDDVRFPQEQFSLAACLLTTSLAGAGAVDFSHDILHGETAPERPLIAIKDPVNITEIHATIFTALGISPKTAFDIEGRPFYAMQDGLGKPVKALFA
jgi:hypothetical protein